MKHLFLTALIALFAFAACEGPLEEEVFSELTPNTFLDTENGMNSLLNSAYAEAHLHSFDGHVAYHYLPAMTSGETWNRGGSIEVFFTQLSDFFWDSNHRYILGLWNDAYDGIRDANIVLDNIENDNFSQAFQARTTAEARFIRGWLYALLYENFGPVPLYVSSSTDSLLLPRAGQAETEAFIERELRAAADALPEVPSAFGRASKGAALGVLTKFYLNTKQWPEVLEVSQEIINLNRYGLVPDYAQVFSLENEGNQEMLWALPRTAPEATQNVNALSFPTDYPLPLPNQAVFAARTYFFDDFINSFAENDSRKELFVTEYTNTSGEHVQLLGNDQTLSLKYEFDPDASGAGMGNDIPAIRYADILLARAEALNEVNGPTQEAIDLINAVRERAGLEPFSLGNFTQASLRDAIFQERRWEFFMEGKAREDQIRQGTFISGAQARGKPAQPFHRLFPIPLVDLDANPALEQNEGY